MCHARDCMAEALAETEKCMICVVNLCNEFLYDILLQSNFKQLLSEMGRKGFVEQLTMVLHQVSLTILYVYQVMTCKQ